MKPINILLIMTMTLNSCFLNSSKNDIEPKANEPFYCKINGVTWRPSPDNYPIGGIGTPNLRFSLDKTDGWFYITAHKDDEFIGIVIKLNPNENMKAGEFIVDSNSESKLMYGLNYPSSSKFEDMYAKSGKVNFSKPSEGTFEFIVYSERLKKEFKITQGQFKLK
jgi:hypothetical protein